jgi:hypothetical protein
MGFGGWATTISPDHKYLFYSSLINYSSPYTYGTYWIRIDNIIDSLKHTNFVPYAKCPIPTQKGSVGVLFNFTVPDSIFYDDDGNNTLTYSATLSNGSPLPSWLSFDSLTRTFSGTPLTPTSAIHTINIKVIATDTARASGSCVFNLTVAPATGVLEDHSQLPTKSQLFQCYPNPFNPTTTIHYSLAKSSFVKLIIYNLLGQQIRTLQNSFQTAGEYSVIWDAVDGKNAQVASGMYFYRLEADNLSLQKKMVLAK